MKKNLGNSIIRYLVSLFVLTLFIYGDTSVLDGFNIDFKLSKNNPYIKEPITLTIDINQTAKSSVMLFKFDIKKSKNYTFNRIDIKTKDDYHNVKITYIYKIYPLKSGNININFDLLQMVTTDEKIEYSFSGDRDNIKALDKIDIPISLKPINIKVKALPKDTQIVGDFSLDYKIKEDSVKSYEPIPINITIKGKGYLPLDLNLIPKSSKYSLFQEVTSKKYLVNYSLAISSKSSFDLDDIIINGFNPKLEKSYKLIIPKHHFSITTPNISEVVDNIDSPKSLNSISNNYWSDILSFFKYLFIFAIGFLTAKLIEFYRVDNIIDSLNNDTILSKIKSSKSEQELLKILISLNDIKYKEDIYLLDNLLYGDKKGSFSDIKKSLILKETTK